MFRGAPHSPVSLLNKASMRSTGLTAEASANLSQTTFTIDKDNSLTLTPVPKPPANVRGGYYDEPRFHKVEFAPESRPASVAGASGVGAGVESSGTGTSGARAGVEASGVEASVVGASVVVAGVGASSSSLPQPQPVVVVDGPASAAVRRRYDVFVPKPRRTYEEHVPDVNEYVDPVGRSSPCRFGATGIVPTTVVRKKSPPSLPVKALIDAFEHDGTPTMRYLRPDERVPLSPAIRHLHDDRPPSSVGYYLCDAAVETRSFAHVADGPECGEPAADGPESEYDGGGGGGGGDDDDATAPSSSFQTAGQPATPDSLESSMLFAQKQTLCDARRREDGGRTAPAEPAPPPSESSNDKQVHVRPSSSSSYKDYMSLGNYNTAPRGWHKGDAAFYRPVTFGVSRPGAVRRADVDARRKSFTDF